MIFKRWSVLHHFGGPVLPQVWDIMGSKTSHILAVKYVYYFKLPCQCVRHYTLMINDMEDWNVPFLYIEARAPWYNHTGREGCLIKPNCFIATIQKAVFYFPNKCHHPTLNKVN